MVITMSKEIRIGADRNVAAFIIIFSIILFMFLWVKTQTYTSPESFMRQVSHPTQNTSEKWSRTIENGEKKGRHYLLLYSTDDESRSIHAKLLITAKNGSYISESSLSPDDVSGILSTNKTDVAEDEYSYEEIVDDALKKGHGKRSFIKRMQHLING